MRYIRCIIIVNSEKKMSLFIPEWQKLTTHSLHCLTFQFSSSCHILRVLYAIRGYGDILSPVVIEYRLWFFVGVWHYVCALQYRFNSTKVFSMIKDIRWLRWHSSKVHTLNRKWFSVTLEFNAFQVEQKVRKALEHLIHHSTKAEIWKKSTGQYCWVSQ